MDLQAQNLSIVLDDIKICDDCKKSLPMDISKNESGLNLCGTHRTMYKRWTRFLRTQV